MTDPSAGPHATESSPGIRAEHATVADPELREALVRDDVAEERGMPADDRETCYGCRAWVTPEHLDSPQHRALLERYLSQALLQRHLHRPAHAGSTR